MVEDFESFFVKWFAGMYPGCAALVGEIAVLQALGYEPHSYARDVLTYLRIVDTYFTAATPNHPEESR